MKLLFLFSASVILSVQTCKKSTTTKESSTSCLKDKIAAFQKQNKCNSAHVDEMSFQEKTVYVFDPGNCGADMTKDVVDNNCNSLGMLGGITGNTKINGEDFSGAKFVQTVWSNN